MIVYGERLLTGPRGAEAAPALLNLAARLGLAGRDGAGLLEIPPSTNGRGLREAGFAPGGYARAPAATPTPPAAAGATPASPRRSPRATLAALYLLHADPLRSEPDRAAWEAALATAQTVIAHASALTGHGARARRRRLPRRGVPGEGGHARAPRRPRAAAAPGDRPPGRPLDAGRAARGWQVIAEVARARGPRPRRAQPAPMASQQLFDAVPFFAGLTLDAIGGRGVRWPAASAAASRRRRSGSPSSWTVPPRRRRRRDGALRLGTFRSLWARQRSTSRRRCASCAPRQVVELSPADAERLGMRDGEQVEVGSNGTRVRGAARLRAAIPGGSVFLVEGTRTSPPTCSPTPLVEVRRVGGARRAAPRQPPAIDGRPPARTTPRRRRARARPPPPTGRGRGRPRDLLRGGRLLRAVVDPALKALAIFAVVFSSCRSCCWPSASCSAASSTATAPTASARSACCSRWPRSGS